MLEINENIFKVHRSEDGKLYIPPKGNTKGRLMLIVSHPGHDDLQGEALLTGAYGEEVSNALISASIDAEDVYITSMVKVGIGSKSKPSTEQIQEFAHILDYEIELVKPKLIMTLGAEVFKRVMKQNKSQGGCLGEIIDSPYGKLLPNYSPGMIIGQDPKKRPEFRRAFQYAKRFLDDRLNYQKFEYVVVSDIETAKTVVDYYIQNEMFDVGYDAEWKGKKFLDDEVMYTFQFSCEPHKAIILNISDDGINENRELLNTVKPLLEHPKSRHLGWNIRADRKRLLMRGFVFPEGTLGFDGMKAVAFFDSRLPKSLETGIHFFTEYEPYYVEFNKAMDAIKPKLDKSALADVKFHNPEVFYKYCGGDAVAHRTACLGMMELMKKLPEIQQKYYYDTYLPLSDYLMDLEMTGIPIDQEVMEELTNQYTSAYERLRKELSTFTKKLGFNNAEYEAFVERYMDKHPDLEDKEKTAKEAAAKAGIYPDLNPASSLQKKLLLFKVLQLEPVYYTKAGKSPKPRAWYNKQKNQTKALYSPSTNGKTLATMKFELIESLKTVIHNPEMRLRFDIVSRLLDLTRVGVFALKFLNKKGTEFVDEEEEDDEEGLKSSYWNALFNDGKIHADFFECLENFRSSSKPNVQNPASKVLSHIPEIFVPGFSKLSKEEKKKVDHLVPRNLRHIFYSGDKDWNWVEVDVAGADLFVCACISQDPDYLNDMRLGNFHLKKAREYFQDATISKDDYSKYVSAKSITFRVAYTSELLSAAMPIQSEIFAESGITIDIDTLNYALKTWERYEKYMEFRERCKAQATELHYIENMYGIRYYFEETDNFSILAGFQNQALAYPIASELAMFLWKVSVEMKKQLVQDGVWMKRCYPVNTVHDANYWVIHKDLLKDNYFPEVCKYFFTDHCKISTGDNFGMEMSIADRWKGKDEVFHGETKWNFETKRWEWK